MAGARVTRSRWGRLVERRARDLLGSVRGAPAVVLDVPGGYPAPREALPDAVVVGAGGRGVVRGGTESLPLRAASSAAVVDTTRPETPADHERRVAELVRVCRPGGTIALVACGGRVASRSVGGVRSWASLSGLLARAGCDVVRVVPFDLLGTFSPWRTGLGVRAERVLGELEDHLRVPEVRRAVRFLERRLVAALPVEQAGSVFVVARRRGGAPEPAHAPGAPESASAVVASRAFGDALLRLARDDAVVRFAAFLDAEIFSPAAVSFDLVRHLAAAAADPVRGETARRALLARRRWWSPRSDVQRLLGAASFRLAHRTMAVLRELPGASVDGVRLPETLEYELLTLFNRRLEPSGEAGEPP